MTGDVLFLNASICVQRGLNSCKVTFFGSGDINHFRKTWFYAYITPLGLNWDLSDWNNFDWELFVYLVSA